MINSPIIAIKQQQKQNTEEDKVLVYDNSHILFISMVSSFTA
jgi:hypothetical protein